ncbi:hypothetical protein A2962_01520 [Candidatus Woesebacteria bacterium RIFCSPLOWO2_01_FULL_39_61]|uniref:GIY-YIG domain-containing protein n=1 Tax=Candidatus Woesebacteria bacterium RIFCSPHIGHO2_02_FULL_39_13 TaxID=1802505 RepID=A0A1F7Z4C5_9BACT|nr:MAG: hypothetical protein A2692_01760 [Candidatus Woesebacteria bacterium RIFCSPHIGHO2_01_FULL_39_95]OGM34523.1 MAG: hypothetical protein A3D01_03210 [Candidatus Woesebacteria bacterium RIFCSPHIGHO2_02_FULL_39_13]OGM38790.1 MAG: hypothetical protein A3E13_01105 [Candidatus Woesebacteria bacterium RIFCSPHIGHO2_12_FULL_40_20]OGM65796.1 MAG: hypothetical protein A2962_01520 [Candidatus Woesebacteria bacterium RIFCSPLOWO2_01_FULL_39_61]OGM73869.1 MAG: hypothetical protein A3H19_04365 [Candidatus
MYFVYILKLNNGQYYSGYSSNLKQRVVDHKKGRIDATKNFRPLDLVYYAGFKTRKLATNFEKYLESSSGFAFRNKHLI